MFGVALLTSALLALADARIYERCELARELLGLGIRREHLATWVCIAYHESRFDTAARNPFSGDHGLLQISELYWCGAGKACSLPCSALRDDDISDDVECALRVYEEHTRLQGNGFLAWVVYPQHCKHNAKKYLADCESSVKTPTVRTDERSRVLKTQSRNVTSFSYNPKIDELLPPYLAISSVFRGNYEKEFEQNYRNKVKVNWLNYKIDNIDDLRLPVFNQKIIGEYTTTTLSTTTTTTPSPLPNIKPPSPRRIESNSFRRKKVRPIFEPVNFIDAFDTPRSSLYTTTPRNIHMSTAENIVKHKHYTQSTTTTSKPSNLVSTIRPSTKDPKSFSSHSAFSSTAVEQQTTASPVIFTVHPVQATTSQDVSTEMINRLSSTLSSADQKTTMRPINQNTTMRPTDQSTTMRSVDQSLMLNKTKLFLSNLSVNKSQYTSEASVPYTLTSTSTAPTLAIKQSPFHFEGRTTQSPSSTLRPWSNSWLTWRTTSQYKTITASTTPKPSSITWTTARAKNVSTTKSGFWSTTPNPNPWTRTRTSLNPKTTTTELLDSNNNVSSIGTQLVVSTTAKPRSTTPVTNSRQYAFTTANPKSDVKSTTRLIEPPSLTTARTTQSIFDLYLNPTKRPKIAFSLPPFKNRALSLRIFAGGTTTHAPLLSGSGSLKSEFEEANKNQIRRQTVR